MKLIICGDFATRHQLYHTIKNDTVGHNFDEVKPYFANADYSILNLESPISEGRNSIKKSGPALKAPLNTINIIKDLGVKCVTLANNHFMDQGEMDAMNTMVLCKEYDIDFVGAGKNIAEARSVLYKEQDGIKFGVYNICEQEFSIADEDKSGCAPLNPIQNFYDIKKGKEKCDFLIVIIHGGTEFYTLPTPRMKETYRFLIDIGADAIINHHQHCYSGYEIYNEKPIFYGIGNFIFDNDGTRNKLWEEGYMVELELRKNKPIKFNLIPYTQTINQEPYLQITKDQKEFNNQIERHNEIINSDTKLKDEFNKLAINKKKVYESYLMPDIPFVKSLYYRNLIPAISQSQRTLLLNLIRCESHRDLLLKILEN